MLTSDFIGSSFKPEFYRSFSIFRNLRLRRSIKKSAMAPPPVLALALPLKTGDEGKLYVPEDLVSVYREKGTGDLMTALLLGWSNRYPDNLGKAAELSVSSLQALLVRTVEDYTRAGHDCQSSSLEIRLIQSQDDIRNPEIKYKAEMYK